MTFTVSNIVAVLLVIFPLIEVYSVEGCGFRYDLEEDAQSDPTSALAVIDTDNCHHDGICLLNRNKTSGSCSCKNGFTGDGVLSCEPMFQCRQPLLRNELLTVTFDVPENRPRKRFYPGDELHYSCDFGLALLRAKSKVRTCQQGKVPAANGIYGVWHPKNPPFCVAAKCKELNATIENGSSDMVSKKYKRGKVVRFACNRGYRLVGNAWATCVTEDSEDGAWSSDVPTCEAIKCSDPGIPRNGQRVGSTQFNVGEVVAFRCSAGYKLIGSKSRRCLENGVWSGSLTSCDNPNYRICPNPGRPANGYSSGRHFYTGYRVHFACDYGFVLIGSKTITCTASGEWTSTTPECKAKYDFDIEESVLTNLVWAIDYMTSITSPALTDLSNDPSLCVYLVLDGSGSVGKENYHKAIRFSKELVRKIRGESGWDGPRFGIIVYSNHSDVILAPHQSDIDTEDIVNLLHNATYPARGTSTSAGLRSVMDLMKLSNSNRTKQDKSVVFLIGEGQYNIGGNPVSITNELKRQGVDIFVIGVGYKSDRQLLNGMASHGIHNQAFRIESYDKLEEVTRKLGSEQNDYSECGVAGETNPGNGKVVNSGAWPWHVALFDNTNETHLEFVCGGSLISEDWILTAAHCFTDRTLDDFIVGMGLTDLDDDRRSERSKSSPIETVIIHPNYKRKNEYVYQNVSTPDNMTSTFSHADILEQRQDSLDGLISRRGYDYDIALVKLKKKITFTPFIRPVCLPRLNDDLLKQPRHKQVKVILKNGAKVPVFLPQRINGVPNTKQSRVTITGWGSDLLHQSSSSRDENSLALLQQSLQVQPRQRCRSALKRFAKLTPRMFCAGYSGLGDQGCSADSGSPVVARVPTSSRRSGARWVQVGVRSWGFNCILDHDRFSFSTDVAAMMPWISSVLSLPVTSQDADNITKHSDVHVQ